MLIKSPENVKLMIEGAAAIIADMFQGIHVQILEEAQQIAYFTSTENRYALPLFSIGINGHRYELY